MIVDVQQASPIPPVLVDRIRRYARRFDCRVFTQFVNRPRSLFRRSLGLHSSKPGSEETRLLIAPAPGDLVIVKGGYGLPPAALRRLQRRGIKEIVVCGVDTDACVLGVMFSLFDAGITCRAKLDHCWSSSGLQAAARRIIQEQFPGSI